MNILLFLGIGLVAGWAAGKLTRGAGFGVVGDLLLGCVGALVGGFVFDLIGLQAYGLVGSLTTAVAGAVILVLVVRAFAGKGGKA